MHIHKSRNGSITIHGDPYNLQYDLKDLFEMSVGPRDNNDGIKACLTYNSPGGYKTGIQTEHAVSLMDILAIL